MAESRKSRLKIKLGDFETEFEGGESLLKDHLQEMLNLIAETAKRPKPDDVSEAVQTDKHPTFILAVVNKIIHALTILTPSELLETVLKALTKTKKWNNLFVDLWISMWIFAAIASLPLAGFMLPAWLAWLVVVRIYEILVNQLNVILVDPHQTKDYAVNSRLRLVIIALLNYFEIILWFAYLYQQFSTHFDLDARNLNLHSLLTSVQTMSGWGSIKPIDELGYVVILAQSMVGIIMTILVIARVVALLRIPPTRDPQERGSN